MLEALLAALAAYASRRVRMLTLLPAVRTCQVGVVRAAELSSSSAFRMRMYLEGGCADDMDSEDMGSRLKQ